MFSEFGSRIIKTGPSGTLIALLALLMGTLVGCHNWSEFGEGPTNPHRSSGPGPSGGHPGHPGAGPDGPVIDGDYEEVDPRSPDRDRIGRDGDGKI